MNHPLASFLFCPKCGSSQFVEHNFKAKHCKDCGFVYYANCSSSVAVFIENEQGELLVCRRAKEPYKGTLDLPGGFVDMDETPEQAVVREVNEELSIAVTDVRYLYALPNVYPYSGVEVHTLDMFFGCKCTDFSGLQAADDVAEAFFLSVDKLDPADFGISSIKKGISNYLQNKFKK